MKPSHFTTPRTMGDAAFIPSADPIERPTKRSNYDAGFMLWLAVIVIASLAAIALTGGLPGA